MMVVIIERYITNIIYNVKRAMAAEVKDMKVSRADAERNRERIIEVAAKLFRERGFDGIGVAELMKSAGLTHGGFYGHFASKEDLMAQASARALDASLGGLNRLAERSGSGSDALAAVASAYLSPAHRDQPGAGCALAALGAEGARHEAPVRAAFTRGVETAVDLLMRLLPDGPERARREQALAVYASMVGALVLSRAVDDTALSDEVLQAVQAAIARI